MESNNDDLIDCNIVFDNVSFTCSSNEYSECHTLVRNPDLSIKSDLEKLGFDPEIIDKAVELHKKSGIGTRRGRRRKQTIFYYVYSAYNTLKIPIEPKKLAQICGINPSEISKAMSGCRSQHNSTPNVVLWSPVEYIQQCLDTVIKKTDLRIEFPENTLKNIIKMTEEVTKSDPSF